MRIRKIKGLQRFLFLLGTAMLMASCVTNKNTQYLQMADDDVATYELFQPESYILQPGDELYIKIEPLTPEVENFLEANQTSSGSAMSQSLYLYSYEIFTDSCIDYPFIGKIKLAGITTRAARKKVEDAMKDYVLKDGKVTVKLVNKYVSILGEVKSPGKYTIYKEGLNIFQVLAMAGDLTTYGNRERVRLVRQVGDEFIVKEFDLRRNDILGSEYFFVKPNDIIYIGKVKGQFFRMENFPTLLTTITSSLSFLLLVLNYSNF